jgi:glutathione S-transferase
MASQTGTSLLGVWQLYHFPLCPFSRKVRLVLSERGIAYELIESATDDSTATLQLGRGSRIPALHDPVRGILLTDSMTICEYLEETAPGPSMLIGSAEQRAEIRRLVAWADQDFYEHVTQPALATRLPSYAGRQTWISDDQNGSRLTTDALLDELDTLLDRRRWLAGTTLSLADLATAAQVSVADYLGAIDWSGHDQAHTWYSVLKSRRSFQPLLADQVEGIDPAQGYSAIDT